MREYTVTIETIRDEAAGIKTFVITRPEGFNFTPGQYCWISVDDFDPSPMAIASGKDDGFIEFSIRAWGDLTNALFEKSPGDTISLDGPYGSSFPLDVLTAETSLYLVGGGTGITPIRSLVKSLPNGYLPQVFYGAKNPDELLYTDEIQKWNATVNLTVDLADNDWEGSVGLVTEILAQSELDNTGVCFVCGPEPMEAATVEYLRSIGFKEGNIFVSLEQFDEEGNVVGPVLPVSDDTITF